MKLLTVLALTAATALPAQTIAIINSTKNVTDATLQSVTNAVATQVHNEFKAAWAKDYTFVFVGKGKTIPSGAWKMYIDDRKGDYHTVSNGAPIGYCHVSGVSVDYWTNTISHEVCEMGEDPFVNVTYKRPDGSTGSVEVCDACEQNNQGYRISSILMSDFVYPSWFKSSGSAPFDQTRLISAPFQILPGGYLP